MTKTEMINSENAYLEYLRAEIDKANDNWLKAMQELDLTNAMIYGKRASDLEAIYYYHKEH